MGKSNETQARDGEERTDEEIGVLYANRLEELIPGLKGVPGIVSMRGGKVKTADFVGDIRGDTRIRAAIARMYHKGEAEARAWREEEVFEEPKTTTVTSDEEK